VPDDGDRYVRQDVYHADMRRLDERDARQDARLAELEGRAKANLTAIVSLFVSVLAGVVVLLLTRGLTP
jgi:hypothetical protein